MNDSQYWYNATRNIAARITLSGPEIQASRDQEGVFIRAMRADMNRAHAEMEQERMDRQARAMQNELGQLAIDRQRYYRNMMYHSNAQWITQEQWEDVDRKRDPDLEVDIGL